MPAVTAELLRGVTDCTDTDIIVETTTSFVFVRLFCLLSLNYNFIYKELFQHMYFFTARQIGQVRSVA